MVASEIVGQAFVASFVAAGVGRPMIAVSVAPPAPDPRPSPDPLLALVARMAERDERALAKFYDATVAKAWSVSLRICRDAALAEEVVADAYHQAWRDAPRFDAARGTPLAWIAMIARSRALDALRARDPAQLHEDPASLMSVDELPTDADPLDLLLATEASSAVHAALARLPMAQRQMLGLAFFRGLTHQEIAAQTGQPLGTIKSQIRRALAAMAQGLAP